MVRRPLVMLMTTLALVLGFMLGYTVAELDLTVASVIEPLKRIPLPDLTKYVPTASTEKKPANQKSPKPKAPEKELRPTPEPAGETAPPLETARLIRIVDGDTLHVMYRGQDETVRMLRVNTPERNRRGYEESTAALSELVRGRKLTIEFEEPDHADRDTYGRVLAYVFGDGENLNVELVRLGWSAFFTKYGPGRYAEEFEAAEKEARAENRGIWSFEEEPEPTPTPTPKRAKKASKVPSVK